jgi:kumamolisin
LIALLNQQIGKPVGFWNPILYSQINANVVRDISAGNNGAFSAVKGWDACTGVGAPIGTNMLAALQPKATHA